MHRLSLYAINNMNMKQIITLITVLSFSISYSQQTDIPDPNFETALISAGYDTYPLNGKVYTSRIDTIIYLDVSDRNITDLTGIQDFDSLMFLNCSKNDLTDLDVSQNIKLWELNCSENQLTTLNLNPWLIELNCTQNKLITLNVTQNSYLNILYCAGNLLTHLNVSQNTNLLELECGFYFPPFIFLGNAITELDLSQNSLLKYLNCSYNDLSCLNLKNGNNHNMIEGTYGAFGAIATSLPGLISTNNPNLLCIEVDDTSWSTTNWPHHDGGFFTYIDSQSVFSNDCGNPCYALSTKENNYNSAQIYPNPFLTSTTIELPSNPHILSIYDIVGNKVREEQVSGTTIIERGDLSKGIYVLEVRSKKQTYSGRLVIE